MTDAHREFEICPSVVAYLDGMKQDTWYIDLIVLITCCYNPNEIITYIFDMHSKTYHIVADLFVHIKN